VGGMFQVIRVCGRKGRWIVSAAAARDVEIMRRKEDFFVFEADLASNQ